MRHNFLLVAIALFTFNSVIETKLSAQSERVVQFQSIDFENGIVEVRNFGTESVDLTGWRFCSHDFDQDRRYSAANGLSGVSLDGGSSLFVYYNNDAPAEDNAINRGDIGGNFALPLDQDAYGMQFYFPGANGSVAFGNSSLIADHIQWNLDGASVGEAQERTGQAVSQGLWSSVGDFIVTLDVTTRIDLIDESGDEAGDPTEYSTFTFVGDVNNDGLVNLLDVAPFVEAISSGLFVLAADVTEDGFVNLLDVGPFVKLLSGG